MVCRFQIGGSPHSIFSPSVRFVFLIYILKTSFILTLHFCNVFYISTQGFYFIFYHVRYFTRHFLIENSTEQVRVDLRIEPQCNRAHASKNHLNISVLCFSPNDTCLVYATKQSIFSHFISCKT